MKLFFTCLLMLFVLCADTHAQTKSADVVLGEGAEQIESPPEFYGGQEALGQFLSDNISYPEKEFNNNVQGRVLVSFIVEKDGSISNIKVTKGASKALDNEAKRVTALMPRWTPGKINGTPVRVQYTLPFNFSTGK